MVLFAAGDVAVFPPERKSFCSPETVIDTLDEHYLFVPCSARYNPHFLWPDKYPGDGRRKTRQRLTPG
jgi:hypothetical protein